MKVITLRDVRRKRLDIKCPKGGFTSYRYLVAKDGMGFSVHKTMIPRGDKQHWHYKKHLEACVCVWGLGLLTDLKTGRVYKIEPDTTYALNNHDDHTFQALEDTVLISIFNPPVKGAEVHKEDGSYGI